jgi:ATP-dependent RNA helicase DBP3
MKMVTATAVDMDKAERKKKRKLQKLEEEGKEKVVENQDNEEKVPKKKKKKKDTEKAENDNNSSAEDTNEPEENCPFRKKFYTMNETTEALSKSAIKEFREKHSITLYGKGRKQYKPLFSFEELGFPKSVMKICAKFDKPTPIQSECWPILGSGKDIIGIAETGSGKTLAFTLPALVHIKERIKNEAMERKQFESKGPKWKRRGPILLIISPTRELAMQSQVVLEEAADAVKISSVCVYGGVAKGPQIQAIRRGVEVIVATPGRLIDLMNDNCCDLSQVSYLVLDEADRMLDQGFERDIRHIISQTHPQRQTALFSATWPDSVRELAHEFLSQPIKVTIGSDDLAAGTRITQIVEVIDDRARLSKLNQLLKNYHKSRTNRILIFVLYKKEAARIEESLQQSGWNCTSIHGDKSQLARTTAVENFRSGDIPLLVATDVAARGLDIPDVDYVINYSFPLTIEDYVHRIGRTGRAGKTGTAYTFFQTCDKARAGELVKVLKDANQKVPEEMNSFDLNIKKKDHKLYGAFGPKDYGQPMKKATKITFDD